MYPLRFFFSRVHAPWIVFRVQNRQRSCFYCRSNRPRIRLNLQLPRICKTTLNLPTHQCPASVAFGSARRSIKALICALPCVSSPRLCSKLFFPPFVKIHNSSFIEGTVVVPEGAFQQRFADGLYVRVYPEVFHRSQSLLHTHSVVQAIQLH